MADVPVWKRALQEPNAIGWIGFFLLVVAIGVATLCLGGAPGRAPAGGASAIQGRR
ncbi:MAG TPA: hypothetical protein VE224_08855 [Pseudolabrys sp.]|nr:hypothetical protein [Pseudolabrys sp.]